MRWLVTGGAGFAGKHLVKRLESRGQECFVTSSAPGGSRPGVCSLKLPDEERSLAVLAETRPDAVVHLAGISFVPDADKSPLEAFAVNVDGTQSLLRALHRFDPEGKIRFVFASTGQVYDVAPEGAAGETLFTEESPTGPRNSYGRTKLAAELAVEVLASASGRTAVIFRPFNHVGPGQREVFAVSSFAKQVAQIERGATPAVLETGNLAVSRDFCDVRDIVDAYALAAEGKVPSGRYNLASGRAVSLEAVTEILQGLSSRPFEIRARMDLFRGGEARSLRGDAGKIRSACGWTAATPLETSVRDALDWWRAKLHA